MPFEDARDPIRLDAQPAGDTFPVIESPPTSAADDAAMDNGEPQIPVYEVPPDALRRPWVSRSFVNYIKAQRLPRRRVFPSLSAALITVLAHVLLIRSAIWSATHASTRPTPQVQGAGSIGLVTDREPVMTLILIDEPQVTHEKDLMADDEMASRGFAPVDRLLTILSPDAAPAVDVDEQVSPDMDVPAATDSAALRAVLFGRYVGQIDARVERAWMRPRTAIGAKRFECQVLVKQDHAGNVQETTLQHCNGDDRWQLSMVQAIQSASPLPAPPDPKVFTQALTLTFTSEAFAPGGSTEGFEPVGAVPDIAVATIQRKQTKDGEIIELRITGSSSPQLTPPRNDGGEPVPPPAMAAEPSEPTEQDPH